MTTRDARGVAAMETEEESIAVYLQHNPDFFERHQAVLTRLRLPHARGGSTISLVERQIEVLREKHAALEGKLAELVHVARANDAIADKLHRFTRRLLRAASRSEAIMQMEASLREDFDAFHSVLVLIGLYVRLTITETPVFQDALHRRKQVKVPMLTVFRDHTKALMVGTMVSLATFVLFYLMTVFALSWGTTALGYSREKFLVMQLSGMICFAVAIPIGGLLAERGRRLTLLWVTCGIGLFGLIMAPMFVAGTAGAVMMMALGLTLMGLTYGPLGTVLSELFPTSVRYTGSSLTFNFAGIFGASLAPYIATGLAKNYGLQYVGYYLFGAAALTLIGLIAPSRGRIALLLVGLPQLPVGRRMAAAEVFQRLLRARDGIVEVAFGNAQQHLAQRVGLRDHVMIAVALDLDRAGLFFRHDHSLEKARSLSGPYRAARVVASLPSRRRRGAPARYRCWRCCAGGRGRNRSWS